MTNDILEQITVDYLQNLGYFTQHNVKYRPDLGGNKNSVHSDIDVLGVHGKESSKVAVASCKSWQTGLKIKRDLKIFAENPRQRISGKEHWKSFRELMDPVWSLALRERVAQLTGQTTFTFYMVVTRYDREMRSQWEQFEIFQKNLPGCEIKLLDMEEMVATIFASLGTTPAHSELSRLLQLIKAGGGTVKYNS